MPDKPISQYYATATKTEWKRLISDPYHRLELDTTLNYLKKYLPASGSVLDAGGGPGRYTIELAKLGYKVVLLDLTPQLLEKAKKMITRSGVKRNVEMITQGSITDLSMFADNHFDAVVCLGGPLSHVVTLSDREKAVSELVRVSRSEGPVFVSVIGRLGVLIKMLKYWPEEAGLSDHFRTMWLTGDDNMWRYEYKTHLFLPEELEQLVSSQGLKIIERVGLEGLLHFKEDAKKVAKTMPQTWKNWLESHQELCTHPAVFATSDHMLIIARK